MADDDVIVPISTDPDPATAPVVMPATVRRTNGEGYPTQFLLDWEQASRNWYQKSVVDLTQKQTEVSAELGEIKASVVTETIARVSADEAFASQITTITADYEDVRSQIILEATTRSTADTALAEQITTLTTKVGDAEAAIVTETTARSEADLAFASQIQTLDAHVAENAAAIESETTARVDADGALATRTTSLETNVGLNTAAITAEQTARSNADAAIASQITTLNTNVNNNTAAITAEASARSSADGALATRTSSLETEVINARAGSANLAARISTVDSARVSGDSALATRASALEAEVTAARGGSANLNAKITSVDTARAAGDAALSSQVTTVESRANSISAGGMVYLSAKATPSGAMASYGWYLTVGSSFAGMEALALSGGGSAIGFTASKFLFTDSGTGKQVFVYSGGKFQFTGDVAIDGSLTINGTIVNGAAASRAFTQGVGASSSGMTTSVNITTRGAAQVLIIANFNGASGGYVPFTTPVGIFQITRNGGNLQTVANNFEASGSGGSAAIAFQQTCLLAVDTPPAGSNTYACGTNNGASIGGVTIAVVELSK